MDSLKDKLEFERLSFLSALGLLSRIPIRPFIRNTELRSEHHSRSQIWYPLVGALLGSILVLCLWLIPATWSPFLAATLVVSIWIAFSGALHLDGLADSVDAWVGGMGDAQKTLRIMKDPTSGPMAVVVLIMALLLKVALVAQLLVTPTAQLSILFVPMLARAWLLPLLYSTPYARKIHIQKIYAQKTYAQKTGFDAGAAQASERREAQSGMATDIASEFPFLAALVSFLMSQAMAIVVLLGMGLSLWIWVGLSLAALAVFALIRWSCINRIGGYTGDVLGAYIELQELALLFALAVLLA